MMAVASDSAKWVIDDIVSSLHYAEEVLSLVGIVCIGKVTLTAVWNLTSSFRVHVWSKLVPRNLKEEYGKWAVVTGATDGIGKGYVAALAKNGINIVLISRTHDKLVRVAREIREQYRIQTEIIQADFARGRPIYEDIGRHLVGKDIGILVNNVGVAGSNPCFFEEVSEDDIWALVNVNVASVPAMTKIVLPGMLARKKGAIINISSSAGVVPLPLFQLYSATKASITPWSTGCIKEVVLGGRYKTLIRPPCPTSSSTAGCAGEQDDLHVIPQNTQHFRLILDDDRDKVTVKPGVELVASEPGSLIPLVYH
ncbi:inactive hydroxysteroid dehydrogenase-like protein 1 [Homarus americanus]|uniref:inactive hydroxysteroid dehydrogenase-like protein 1 n=1 Tax=Homarus americanus TaxID=6706 RepID=UPI001C444910|nr:inactive hydroxysteroid dehydrogenase-like protein 1 [Homarus americanus]